MTGTRFYNIWGLMIKRCNNPKVLNYNIYGGRGIKVCNSWLKFENFWNDMFESYSKHCEKFGEKQTSIDRIKNNLGYLNKNCRWATRKEQQRNTSRNRIISFNNKTQSAIEWSEETNIPSKVILSRLDNLHWSIEKALTTPIRFKSLCQKVF